MDTVIFLDFDGVIRVPIDGGWAAPDSSEFCRDRMRILAATAGAFGAKIVVSSDWRHLENRGEIERLLSPHLNGLLHDDWMTPVCGHRWNEVQRWLSQHPEVTSYAILEDFEAHFHGCPPEMADRIVLCSHRYGLTPARASDLHAKLQRK